MTIFVQHLKEKYKHHLFPLCPVAKGRQQSDGLLDQVSVESWEEINPGKMFKLIFLCRQDICSEVVLVEVPLTPEHVQHIEHGGAVNQLLGGRGGAHSSKGSH